MRAIHSGRLLLLATLCLLADHAGAGHLVNLSTRVSVETGDSVAIAGFVIQGTGPKQVLIRALGPSLQAAGVSGALADPALRLVNPTTGAVLATNDNWNFDPTLAARLTALGLNQPQANEAIVALALDPGSYTAIVSGSGGSTGIGLVEVYDAEPGAPCALINLTTRGPVRAGAGVMIGGFVIDGTAPKRVLVRALGPSLSAFGVPGVLANPSFEVVDALGARVGSNDDWQTQATDLVTAIRTAALTPSQTLEAALPLTLTPGAYTVVVNGPGGGNALVEVYDLDSPSPSPGNYARPTLPANFSQPPIVGQDNTPAANPITDAGAALGRVLFYDTRLSANRTIACASCHQQASGFSDHRAFSVGFNGGLTGRNSMGLSNARWYQRRAFFWDERAATLEDQVLQPIQNAVEMGLTLPELVTRVSAEPFYGPLFRNAFGTTQVTSDRISRALAQFVRSIVSTNSKYDAGVASNFANFTPEENLGRQLFNGRGNCNACHATDNFVPGAPIFNNGLENPYVDKGVGALTGRAQDEGLFKVPSLRNVELTAPYMHDGRFATLEAVVDFYDRGVVDHPNLSGPLRNNAGQPRRLNLTPAERAALVAFLKTLTDSSLATDRKFASPF